MTPNGVGDLVSYDEAANMVRCTPEIPADHDKVADGKGTAVHFEKVGGDVREHNEVWLDRYFCEVGCRRGRGYD
jgi:hypothetical protein